MDTDSEAPRPDPESDGPQGDDADLHPKVAKVTAKAEALAAKPLDDDHDKAPEHTGDPVDPGIGRSRSASMSAAAGSRPPRST